MSDLPSLDQPQAYVVVGPDDQRGPYTLELLIGEVVAGRLHDATPVWWPGLADWTTMTGHPALAAEIQRRRSPAAAPPVAPAASAFAPPVAAPAPQPASQYQPAAQFQPVAQPEAQYQPVAQPQEPAPGQYQQAETYGGYSDAIGGYAATATPGQDYSTEMYSGYGAPAQPAVEPSPPEEPVAPVSPVSEPVQVTGEPVEAQESTQLIGDVVAADITGGDETEMHPAAEPYSPGAAGGMFSTGVAPPAEAATETEEAEGELVEDHAGLETVVSDTGVVMEVEPIEPTPADFAAVDQPEEEVVEGFRAAGGAMGLDPRDGEAFAALIARSRARAEAADIVGTIDDAFASAVLSAATAQGLSEVERHDDAENHNMSFRTEAGDTWNVTLGKVTGAEVGLRDGDVALEASCTSTTYGGSAEGGTGEHGEIVISTQEWGGAATARVSLLLPIADYVAEDHSVDSAALDRDLQAVIANVRHRLR